MSDLNDLISEMTRKSEQIKNAVADLTGFVSETEQEKDDPVQKVNDAIEKLNSSIAETEKNINDDYGKIGYQIYCAYRDNPLPEVSDLISEVTELQKRTEEYRAQMEEYKSQVEEYKAQIEKYNAQMEEYRALMDNGESKIVCPQCGNKCDKGSRFCAMCGYKFPEEEKEDNAEQTADNSSEETTENSAENNPEQYIPKFCRICGAELDPGSLFCGNCGAKVISE